MRTRISVIALAAAMAVTSPMPVFAQEAHSFRQVNISASVTQLVTAGPNETVEVILPDGTSIVLAPGASVLVALAPDGTLSFTVQSGIVRVAGGFNNSAQPIAITTQDAQLVLVSGAAIIAVENGQTRAHLLNGESLLVTAGGTTREIYRPGFQVTVTNGRPSGAARLTQAALVADLEALSEGLESGLLPQLVGPVTSSGAQPAPEEDADTSFELAATLPSDTSLVDEISVEPTVMDPPNIVQPPVVVPPVVEDPFDLAGSLGSLGGFTPSTGETADTVVLTNTTTVDGSYIPERKGYADFVADEGDAFHANVSLGPTTNRIFTGPDLSPAIDDLSALGAVSSVDGGTGNIESIEIYFGTDFAGLISEGLATNEDDDVGLFRYESLIPIGTSIISGAVSASRGGSGEYIGGPLLRTDTTLGTSTRGFMATDGIWNDGSGVITNGIWRDFQTPGEFVFADTPGSGIGVAPVRDNGFIFLDSEVLTSLNWVSSGCATCLADFNTAIAAEILTQGGGTIRYSDFYDSFGEASGTVLFENPNETRRFVYATGSVDRVIDTPNPLGVIDRFHLSAGMEGPVLTSLAGLPSGMHLGDGNRAFFRAQSWTELDDDFATSTFTLATSDLAQSDIYVINPNDDVVDTGGGTAFTNPKLFYADLGLATDASGNQVSTISAFIGEVAYRYADEPTSAAFMGITKTTDAIVTAHAVGSSRGLNAAGLSETATLLSSDYRSTASGGDNPNIDAVGTTSRMGFFVIENAGQVFDDVGNPTNATIAALTGGTENTLGGGSETFANLRLATGRSTDPAPVRAGFGMADIGYAAGILDVENAGSVVLGAIGAPDLTMREDAGAGLAPNLAFSGYDPIDNSFAAVLNGIALGGSDGTSAYVTDQIYGTRSADSSSDMALISGPSVASGLPASFQANVAGYDHVKWGFFFGDLDNTLGARQHAHLGSFAGGTPISAADAQAITAAAGGNAATVRYEGHAIGNVVQNGSVTTQTGTYRDTFDFGSRTGSASLSLGTASLSGPSSATANLGAYTGSLTGGGLTGELNGRFIGGAANKTGVGASAGNMVLAPGGVAGSFSISDGNSGGYRAIGTFGGE